MLRQFLAGLSVVLMGLMAMTACAGNGSLIVELDPDAANRFREKCQSVDDGERGTLDGVFEQVWDEITFAYPGSAYDDVSAETGAVFDPALRGQHSFEGLIVLQHEGQAIAAFDAEQFPYRLADESQGIITVLAPGRFVRQGTSCVFSDEG